ncbi:hypothetical protein D1122_22220, partial [Cereibacter sphaeroides]|uniref:hypothetical protein n=1 Tax=Cereibacter sphaeroides TaxID=1063 RepID=UPI000EEF9602
YTACDSDSDGWYAAISLDDREVIVPPRPSGMGSALDAHLMAAAPDLAQTIAGMEWEYGVEDTYGEIAWMIEDHVANSPGSEAEARKYLSSFTPEAGARLVRRLVGPAEVVEEA